MVSDQEKNLLVRHHKHTTLWYERINKKLWLHLTIPQINEYIYTMIIDTAIKDILKKWKNYYISNVEEKIMITINSFTYSVITVNRVK